MSSLTSQNSFSLYSWWRGGVGKGSCLADNKYAALLIRKKIIMAKISSSCFQGFSVKYISVIMFLNSKYVILPKEG